MSQPLRISARNQLKGVVEEIRTEGLLAQVRLRVGAAKPSPPSSPVKPWTS